MSLEVIRFDSKSSESNTCGAMDQNFNRQQFGAAGLPDLQQAAVRPNQYLDVPYEKRWECLKPVILQFYLGEKLSISQLAKRMSEKYSFSALYVHCHPASLCSSLATPKSCF